MVSAITLMQAASYLSTELGSELNLQRSLLNIPRNLAVV